MFCLSHSSYSPGVSQKDYSIEKSHKRSSYSLKLFLCLSFLSITQTCFTFSETITVYVGESHKLFTSIVVCLSVQLLIQTFLCLVYHPNIFTQTPFWVYHTNCSCKCFYWCSITQTKYIPTTEPLFVFWYLIQAIYPNCFYCWSMTQVIHPIVFICGLSPKQFTQAFLFNPSVQFLVYHTDYPPRTLTLLLLVRHPNYSFKLMILFALSPTLFTEAFLFTRTYHTNYSFKQL